MIAKDFRNVLLFMCNRWSKEECNLIFNPHNIDLNSENYRYSLGWHIWNKWLLRTETNYGSLNCIASFILEDLDNNSLQKLIDRSLEYYNK